MRGTVVFVDVETTKDGKRLLDIGAWRNDKGSYHSASKPGLYTFAGGADFVAGHNIVQHDLKYLPGLKDLDVIDTLYLSPLLFPENKEHALSKAEKITEEEHNNPAVDARKSCELFSKETAAFLNLSSSIRQILYGLLYDQKGFSGFFKYMEHKDSGEDVIDLIAKTFRGRICSNANIPQFVVTAPVELSYALMLVNADCRQVPPYLLNAFPRASEVLRQLRHVNKKGCCEYCDSRMDLHTGLKEYFGFDEFRLYEGENLQEQAAEAALAGESLLAIFPTGGGKSLAFQLPALMEGKAAGALTIVISPLQALMKDQIDGLQGKGITEAVTVNGLLDPLERAEAYERVGNGSATLLYVSPETLRSRTLERKLMDRDIARIVIDEAHCFSAWGQDFRPDYLYIADFIKRIQDLKHLSKPIPVSCFTATARQKVISDILDYFAEKLGLKLRLFASKAERVNLHYKVIATENDSEKYNKLRILLEAAGCPAVVYASRVNTVRELADKLTSDGFPAAAFYGKLDRDEKVKIQEDFLSNKVKIMTATSAFGMGVDKKDIGLVVHYEISSSIEDYLQEAGRAGRDPSLDADCYVLFSMNDLDKQFRLLKDTKLSFAELQQVWRAVKSLTRDKVQISALELGRQAGWDEANGYNIETKVRTAVSVLEQAGYLKRGLNSPRVFATSIQAENMIEASSRIDESKRFDEIEKMQAKRIMARLLSSRSISNAGNDDAESRVDYLADTLGIDRKSVERIINTLRLDGLLSDSNDMTAYLPGRQAAVMSYNAYHVLEEELLSELEDGATEINLKRLNEKAQETTKVANIKKLQTLLLHHVISGELDKEGRLASSTVRLKPSMGFSKLRAKCDVRQKVSSSVLKKLYELADGTKDSEKLPVEFSVTGLFKSLEAELVLGRKLELADVEDAILYLSRTGILKIEGGFLVFYNSMEIQRLNRDQRSQFKKDDYRTLERFYAGKVMQIHIVGEYANMMLKDEKAARIYVSDYFNMEHEKFTKKYFSGRLQEIARCISEESYKKLFGDLSEKQTEIIEDMDSPRIVVAAGPGSGKTRVLVHKLAALRLLDEVKAEQLLMLTFSRAAATEFKKRLYELIGEAAAFVEIRTFHSYCFDLLGLEGRLEGADEVEKQAVELIEAGEAEQGKVTKSVIVVDEAQDMSEDEYKLLLALLKYNESLRIIAVGDDDQNIFSFRGSSSEYMAELAKTEGAKIYELTKNYRSQRAIVAFANDFVKSIPERLKLNPIEADSKAEGDVQIVRHGQGNMIEAAVNDIMAAGTDGSRAILAWTNNEALEAYALLRQRGVKARLIQDMGKAFKLENLIEMRYFMTRLGSAVSVITEDQWRKARSDLRFYFRESSALPLCERILDDFEAVNREKKYRSDFLEFLSESKAEDFISSGEDAVCVSTIHKAKGREFDTVSMVIASRFPNETEDKRVLYVGFTRAKKRLIVHTGNDLLDKYRQSPVPGLTFRIDRNIYGDPSELLLPVGFRDVNLGFFKDKKEYIVMSLRSGMKLSVKGEYLVHDGKRVAMFSRAFKEKLGNLRQKGYAPVSATITYILYWKGKEDEEESAVVLSLLRLKAGMLEERPSYRASRY